MQYVVVVEAKQIKCELEGLRPRLVGADVLTGDAEVDSNVMVGDRGLEVLPVDVRHYADRAIHRGQEIYGIWQERRPLPAGEDLLAERVQVEVCAEMASGVSGKWLECWRCPGGCIARRRRSLDAFPSWLLLQRCEVPAWTPPVPSYSPDTPLVVPVLHRDVAGGGVGLDGAIRGRIGLDRGRLLARRGAGLHLVRVVAGRKLDRHVAGTGLHLHRRRRTAEVQLDAAGTRLRRHLAG